MFMCNSYCPNVKYVLGAYHTFVLIRDACLYYKHLLAPIHTARSLGAPRAACLTLVSRDLSVRTAPRAVLALLLRPLSRRCLAPPCPVARGRAQQGAPSPCSWSRCSSHAHLQWGGKGRGLECGQTLQPAFRKGPGASLSVT